jgi:filamentous hemagglutinin family protein
MNRGTYRLVFNATRGTWMAVMEWARGHGKRSARRLQRRTARVVSVSGLAALLLAAPALARAPRAPLANPLPVPATSFVERGTVAAPTIDGTRMAIRQETAKAVLNWNSFDIESGYRVTFSHPNAAAATLNRIGGNDPSVIRGMLESVARDTGGTGGAIYLVNRNGILFAEGAQVNVGGLVASSLNISNDRFEKGLYTITDGTAAFEWDGDRAGYLNSFVRVAPGTEILTADGGFVMLFAPNVINEGRIDTSNGQAILAAGAKVYLAASNDLRLRGVLVEVDPFDPAGEKLGGTVVNRFGAYDRGELATALRDNGMLSAAATSEQTDALIAQRVGQILARTGNATLIGHAVNQSGRVSATTTVSRNGSIYLLARDSAKAVDNTTAGTVDRISTRTGTLILGSGSMTEVQPEMADKTTSIDSQEFYPSEVALMGHKVHLQGSAAIVAPSGKVTVEAVVDPSNKRYAGTSSGYGNDSRIVLDAGSRIDASGLKDVAVDISRHTVMAELFGNELRDAPLQRNGILYRQKIKYDLRKGIKLADTSGYEAQIGRTVVERSTSGGSVALKSEGDVVVRQGATVDVSGGWLRYNDGYVGTTKLLSNGIAYDISTAPADIVYDGFRVIDNVFAAGYTEGKDAGKVEVVGRGVVLDGSLVASTHVGRDQRDPGGPFLPPHGGTLILGDSAGSGDSTQPDYRLASVVIDDVTPGMPVGFDDDPLHASLGARAERTTLSPQVFSAGFSQVEIYANGEIEQNAKVTLNSDTEAKLKLVGNSININADLHAPGAALDFQAVSTVVADGPDGSGIRVAPGITISTAGTWSNDAIGGGQAAAWRNAGSISMISASQVLLGAGSLLDVSAGAWRTAAGKLKMGKAGSITLNTNAGSGASGSAALILGGELRGYGFDKGGTLNLTAPDVRIDDTSSAGTWLTGSFFSSGGFGAYNVTGIGGLAFGYDEADPTAQGLIVAPQLQTLLLKPLNGRIGSSQSILDAASIVQTGPEIRKPVDISLSAVSGGGELGVLTVGDNATLRTEAGGKLALAASEALYVGGILDAPGGSIDLKLTHKAGSASDLADLGQRSLWLGAKAQLLARGALKPEESASGRRNGSVLAGGSVSLSTEMGYIVGEAGSKIDVSGTRAILDLKQPTGVQPTVVASNSGSISLDSRDGIMFDSTLVAAAGGDGAAAGNLSVHLDRRSDTFDDALRNAYPKKSLDLILVQESDALPSGMSFGEPIDGAAHNGRARLAAARINAGGFDEVSLAAEHRILFDGEVELATRHSLVLDAPALQAVVGETASALTLSSAWVKVGNSHALRQGSSALVGSSSTGTGQLTIKASDLVDLVGNLSLQGIGTTSISAWKKLKDLTIIGGDMRFQSVSSDAGIGLPTGSLTLGGALTIEAAQSYPTTLSDYVIGRTEGTSLAVTFSRAGDNIAPVPLSAGGSLTVNANTITQGGVLRAPLGAITLAADGAENSIKLETGSTTSTSADGLTVPYGVVENGSNWIFPLPANSSGNDRSTLISAPPEKRIKLAGPDVKIAEGATIDLSGGGDLYAYEFMPGLGGSSDYLGQSGVLAVMPGYSASFAPVDPYYSLGTTLKPGDQVSLSGGGGLAAGTYTLLPGHYALLPGAFVVTQLTGYRDILPSGNRALTDGSAIVAGKRTVASSGATDARTSGFLVESAEIARTKAQYDNYSSSSFFTARAVRDGTARPRLANDAGRLAVSATNNLQMDGNLLFSHLATARGGEIDIVAPKLAVTGSVAAKAEAEADGFLAIDAARLSSFGAESLVLGAEREQSEGGRKLVTGITSNIRIDTREQDSEAPDLLRLPEFVATARELVEVRADSRISATDTAVGRDEYLIEGKGALLRVSGMEGLRVTRTGADKSGGVLRIAEKSVISGAAVELDATKDTLIAQDVDSDIKVAPRIEAESLSIASSNIGFGTAVADSGLNVNDLLLGRLQAASELRLRSYGAIDFVSGYTVGTLDTSTAKPVLRNLILDTKAIRGFGSGESRIQAASITLTNTTGSDAGTPAVAIGGTLHLEAKTIAGDASSGRIVLGPGNTLIEGFGTVKFDAAHEVAGSGTGSFTAGGTSTQLDIQTGRVTAATGAITTIRSDGEVNIAKHADATTISRPEGLGARLTIEGTAIAQLGVVDLVAGELALQSRTGDLVLGAGSLTRVAGEVKTFDGETAYVNAGNVSLTADNGSVRSEAAALVDVSANAGGGDAGMLAISAVNGSLDLQGDVAGHAGNGGLGGRFAADAISLPKTNADDPVGTPVLLDGLAARTSAGGFDRAQSYRIRQGNVKLSTGAEIKAREVGISVDGGSLEIAGSVNASGVKGGTVGLFASDDLTLAGSIDAHATSAGQRGGAVTLGSTNGSLALNVGSSIDAGGGTGGRNGDVVLRARRTGAGSTDTDVAVTAVSGSINNAANISIEAVKTYSGTAVASGNSSGTTVGMTTVNNDIVTLMSRASAIKTRLGKQGDENIHVRPGVEITSIGDLSLNSDWNLYSASRPGGEPGYLTLRAVGNLKFDKSLSDGFTAAATAGTHAAGSSWSYRLIGGADSDAADPLRVIANRADTGGGDVVVAANTRIRTGDGTIQIAAGRDIVLAADTSTIYTAGVPVVVTGGYTPDGFLTRSDQKQSFGYNGGNVSLTASRDVKGIADSQLISSWLYRQGNYPVDTSGNPITTNGFTSGYATAWWSRYDLFRQDVGALGGGDVSIVAGGDIRNISAMLPTSGRMATRLPDGSINMNPDNARLSVTGGGDLEVHAAGNIAGGQFMVMDGTGSISAGASLQQGDLPAGVTNSYAKWYPILALANGSIQVSARGDVNLDAVINPTTVTQHSTNAANKKSRANYVTYIPTTSVALKSLNGDVNLLGGNRDGATSNVIELTVRNNWKSSDRLPNDGDYSGLTIWAPSLAATSFSGDISVPGDFTLFPAPRGNLTLLAGVNVNISGRISLGDVDPASLPRTDAPYNDPSLSVYRNLRGDQTLPKHHASNVLHDEDPVPVHIVAELGDISGNQSKTLILPKAARLYAGRDISDVGIVGQNITSDDATSIEAGRDIRYSPKRSDKNALEFNQADIQIGGPGRVEVIAGRDIDLGTSTGIISRGNLANPYLPDSGANIRILAGKNEILDTPAFIEGYLRADGESGYLDELMTYLGEIAGQSPEDAVTAVNLFRMLGEEQRLEFAYQVSTKEFIRKYLQAPGAPGSVADYRQAWNVFSMRKGLDPAAPDWRSLNDFGWEVLWPELRASGQAASVVGETPGDYSRGLGALATLGWSTPYQHDGSLSLIFSQIKTERGGNVEVLAPGGDVNVGLSTLPAGLKKDNSQLGIMTAKGGEILAMTLGDFQVNQSRVFSLAGGDIMIWSSEGNIDAGRGKKTAVVIPPPVIRIDKEGRFYVEYPGAASGSGIGALKTNPDAPDSNVDLFAPKGSVNAGDAGIRSSGKITIAAQRVIGADNIVSTGGPVVGVKVDAVSAAPAVPALYSGAEAAKAAEQAASSAPDSTRTAAISNSILTVEILALGEDDDDKTRR